MGKKKIAHSRPSPAERRIHLYFNRWKFSHNIGDSIMISALFRPIKEVYAPCYLEVITDDLLVDIFRNDPHVDRIRSASWIERHLPYMYYHSMARRRIRPPLKRNYLLCVKPSWRRRTFEYLSNPGRLEECIKAPHKNILSYNFALQISDELASYPDLRPRLYLTNEEIELGRQEVGPNAVGINIALMRDGRRRSDGERRRYRPESWRRLVRRLKEYDPLLRICEIGQNVFEGIGDFFLPNAGLRTAAARLNAMRLVVLSDGGIHNICNAIDKEVLLFQACEINPPDLFIMHNALFNESYHTACRLRCHIFAKIFKIPSAADSCVKECYNLDPLKLADDCIAFLRDGTRPNH